jgi:hypothetical protein
MIFPGEATKTIPFHTVSEPDQWLVSDKPAYLVVTEKNWPSYYSSLPRGSDFANSIYVVASLGMKPNPAYRVRIRQLKRVEERITVEVEHKEPEPGKVYPQIIVHPIDVAKVAKANLEQPNVLTFTFRGPEGRQLAQVKLRISR